MFRLIILLSPLKSETNLTLPPFLGTAKAGDAHSLQLIVVKSYGRVEFSGRMLNVQSICLDSENSLRKNCILKLLFKANLLLGVHKVIGVIFLILPRCPYYGFMALQYTTLLQYLEEPLEVSSLFYSMCDFGPSLL